MAFIEPVDFSPSPKKDITKDGLTYGFMTAPGGILQTSQTVSPDISWWTVPRIAIEVALWAYSIYKMLATPGQAALSELSEAEVNAFNNYLGAQKSLKTVQESVEFLTTHNAVLTKLMTKYSTKEAFVEALSKLNNQALSKFFIEAGSVNEEALKGTRALGPENFILAGDSIFAGLDSTKFHIVIDPSRKEDYLQSDGE